MAKRPRQWHEFIIQDDDDFHNVESFLHTYCKGEGRHYRSEGTGTSAISTDANLKHLLPTLYRLTAVRLRDPLTCLCEQEIKEDSNQEWRCYNPAKYLGRDGNIYCKDHIAAHQANQIKETNNG